MVLALWALSAPLESAAQVPRFKETPYANLDGLKALAPAARKGAALELGRFRKNDAAIRALANTLYQDPNVGVRQAAAMALAKMGAHGKSYLPRAAVCDPDPGTREGLAAYARRAKVICHQFHEGLGLAGTLPGDEKGLIAALKHPVPATRAAAMKALARRRSGPGMQKIWLLSSSDPVWKLRARAIKVLVRMYRKKAFTALRHSITKDPDARVRAQALTGLGQIGHPRAAKIIATSAKVETVPMVVKAATRALAALGTKAAVRELSFLAQMHSNEETRALAVAALASIKKFQGPIKKVLAAVLANDRSGKVRAAALKALSTDTGDAACKARASRIDDPSGDVRAALIEQLGACKPAIARPALVRAARQDHDAAVRRAAAKTLVKIGAADARETLVHLLLNDRDEETRKVALAAVKSFPARVSYKALGDVAKSDPKEDLRKSAVAALARMNAMLAVPALSQVLERDRSEGVRLKAAYALARYSDAGAYKALTRAAKKDASAKVRRAATSGAAKSPAQRAYVNALLPQTIDPDAAVRLKAVTKLCALQVPRTYRALVRAMWMDESPRVRAAVARGLADVDHPLADLGLVVAHDTDSDASVVRTVEETQRHRVQRVAALVSMARHPDAGERLEAIKTFRPSPFKKLRETVEVAMESDRDAAVRRAAARAVAEYQDRAALKSLLKASQKELDPKTRRVIVQLYNQLRAHWNKVRNELSVARLIQMLRRGKPGQKVAAAQALGIEKDRRAFTFLKVAAAARDPRLRFEATLALSLFGATGAIAEAITAEKDKKTKMRLMQLDFLRKSGKEKILAALSSGDVKEVAMGVRAAALRPNNAYVPWLVRAALANPRKQIRLAAVRTLVLHDHPMAQWAIRVAAANDASNKLRTRMWRWAVYADLRN